jgi:hypothetical protein
MTRFHLIQGPLARYHIFVKMEVHFTDVDMDPEINKRNIRCDATFGFWGRENWIVMSYEAV